MPLSVLLVFHKTQDKTASIHKLPPLGILSIASMLESKGIKCDVLDFSIDQYAKIVPERYDIIGFGINISNRISTLNAISDIKTKFPNKPIIIGGSLCISNPEYFLSNPHIDVICAGEGEEALIEYLTAQKKESVKGLYIRNGSGFTFTGQRQWIDNLDELPFPALNKVNLQKYNCFPKRKRPVSSIMTSRGCPYNCVFCSHSMGRKWRYRSAENVVNEIEWQVNTLGVKEICIFDDNFSLNKKRAIKICNLLIEKRINVILQFTNGLRADSLDENLLLRLKKAGTWLIGLAPESGNPKVLKKIRKGFGHHQIEAARKQCKKIGIITWGFFMIGFPFETKNDILDTINYAKNLDCEISEFNKVVPYSKTELYEIIEKENLFLTNTSLEVQSYHTGTITTHSVGDLKQNEVKKLIKKAYREFYLRPSKMIDIVKAFSIKDLFVLTLYAIRTKNI